MAKFVNVGKTGTVYPSETNGNKKAKVFYPDLRIEKDIGDFEIDEELTLICKVRVSALRADEYGESTTFEVREVGVGGMTAKDMMDKEAEKILKQQ